MMKNYDEKDKKDDKDKNPPAPPGTPDRTPIENPDEEAPMGDPQPHEKKSPRI